MPRTVLGIDPGSRHTGVAVIRKSENRYEVLHCGVIRLGHLENHFERLELLYREVTNLISQFQPDECGIESPLFGKDPIAAIKLGRAQAAAALAAISKNIPIQEYLPKSVKKSLTGNGNATKQQVAYMLDKILGLNSMKFPLDATDALAVAWCHFERNSFSGRESLRSSRKSHQNAARTDWEKFIAENPGRVRS